MFFSLVISFLPSLFCATPNKLEKENVEYSTQWHPPTDRQICVGCVCFFSHDTWKISAGYDGKKKQKQCVPKNDMLAQVGIILLTYHIQLLRLDGMDDKWDG
jgi:hypothetical protein